LVEKYKHKYADYWTSRRLVQRCLDDWIDEESHMFVGEKFRLLPKKGE
jgi:hypothetical protein